MENTLSTILIVLALLIGAVCGAVIVPGNDTIEYVDVPGETVEVIKEVFVDVPAEVSTTNQLDLAVAEFLIAVENEEDEAGNDINVLGRYDFDEMEVSRIYDDYNIEYQDDETTIDFKIRLRFDEDDARAVKKTYNVTVIFEEDEDTIVEFIKL